MQSPPPLDAPLQFIGKDPKSKELQWDDDGVLVHSMDMEIFWRFTLITYIKLDQHYAFLFAVTENINQNIEVSLSAWDNYYLFQSCACPIVDKTYSCLKLVSCTWLFTASFRLHTHIFCINCAGFFIMLAKPKSWDVGPAFLSDEEGVTSTQKLEISDYKGKRNSHWEGFQSVFFRLAK